MRTLLAGTACFRTEDHLWLARQWLRVARILSPESDILVVETPGPLGDSWEDIWADFPETYYILQPSNLGHLAQGGQDGWGRDMTTALEWAMARDYDYLALIDTDFIFTKPLAPIFQHMAENSSVALADRSRPNYPHWLEGIHFFSVEWLRQMNFPTRYDWRAMRPGMFAEERMERAIGLDLEIYPLRGIRDDHHTISPETIRAAFPDGCDWLTHASREAYEALMEWYGLGEG